MARPRSDIRHRVIEAARTRFLADGVDGSSLRGIAREASTNIGMIYYYFPTKDDLFLGVVEDVYAVLLEDLTEALSPAVPVEERLRRLYARAGSLSEVEFDVIRIVIREALVSKSRLERLIERFSSGHLPMVLGTLLEGVESGALRSDLPVPAMLSAMVGVGLLPQIVRRLVTAQAPHTAHLFAEPDRLAEILGEVILRGIGAPGL